MALWVNILQEILISVIRIQGDLDMKRNKQAVIITHKLMRKQAYNIIYKKPRFGKKSISAYEDLRKDFWWLVNKWHKDFIDNCPNGSEVCVSSYSSGNRGVAPLIYLIYNVRG